MKPILVKLSALLAVFGILVTSQPVNAAASTATAVAAATTRAPASKAASSSTSQAPDSAARKPEQAEHRRKEMQALMARIRDTNDPIERRRLLAQHREMMVEQMQAMQHMGCSTGIRSGERMQCDQIDQDRMDMINDLLHQMLEHEKAER